MNLDFPGTDRRRWLVRLAAIGGMLGMTADRLGRAGDGDADGNGNGNTNKTTMLEKPTTEDWAQASTLISGARPVVSAQNGFGLRLLNALAAKPSGSVVFLSPLSIFMALALAEAGAGGTTRTAMRKTLGLLPLDANDTAFDPAVVALQRALKLSGAQLAIANALWVGAKTPVAPAYLQRAKSVFRAPVTTLKGEPAQAAKQVNDWVSENTRGRIPEIVSPDQLREAVAVLTNAIYFAARWHSRFSPENTVDGVFRGADGSSKTLPFMRHPGLRQAYRRASGYEGVMLSYDGSSVSAYFLLPEKGKRPAAMMATLDVPALIAQGGEYDVDLRLPRLQIEYGASLAPALKELGMDVAFRYPEANFRPMGSELFYLSEVIHKARLEIDEEGTVAAAATAVIMAAGSAAPKPREKKVLVFDRPFGLLIADTRTGAVLFAGAIERLGG